MGKHEDIKSSSKPARPSAKKKSIAAEGEISLDIYSSSKKGKKKGKKMKRWKKVLIAFTSVIVSLCLFAVAAWYNIIPVLPLLIKCGLNYNYEDLNEGNLGINGENSQSHIMNIALFGVDTRDDASMKGLSDSIMVLSINKKNREMKLVSFLRDSVVDIDGVKRKINYAYSRGGYELAIKTLNENFKLDIKEFATVNFGAMAELVDMVGYVEIEVTQGEIDDKVYGINALIAEQARIKGVEPEYVTKPGLQKLNGIQAVAWARIRKSATADGQRDDFGRTDRQREVLNQLFRQATKMDIIDLISLANKFASNVTTSLDENEIAKLVPLIKGASLKSERIPKDYSWRIKGNNGGVSAGLYYDLGFAQNILKEFLYEDVPFDTYIEQNGITYNEW